MPSPLQPERARVRGGSQTICQIIETKLDGCREMVWQRLRNRELDGLKFRRQHVIGRFIVDFVCIEKKLIIELDGGQHAITQDDAKRTEYLNMKGYKVIRFWDHDILQNGESVLKTILAHLAPPHPDPLPRSRGRGEKPNQPGHR